MLTWFTAIEIRVSTVIWYTSANSSVIFGLTSSIGSTITGIYTLFISTCQSIWTLWICQAFIGFTLYIRTTLVSRRTLASCSVNVHSTNGFDTALFKWTRILTFSLDACLVEWALIVILTASYIKDRILKIQLSRLKH